MPKASSTGVSTSELQETDIEVGELFFLPMHKATWKALSDAALRDGLTMQDFMQAVFERAVREGVRTKR